MEARKTYQLCGVILLPLLLIVSQVAREGLLAPGDLGGVADGREGTDGLVELRIAQAQCQGAMAPHGVAHDGRLPSIQHAVSGTMMHKSNVKEEYF